MYMGVWVSDGLIQYIMKLLLTSYVQLKQSNNLQFYYHSPLMTLNKSQIQLLQHSLTPPQRKFSLLQVIQKFPSNSSMHQTFRQICLHYQSSSLSFSQIMQYLFGQFNRISQQNTNNISNNKNQIVRVQKKYGDQQFKVVLKGAKSTTQRIKQLLIISENQNKQQQMYAVTNTEVCQYCINKQCFLSQVIKLHDNVIIKATIFGNIIAYITKSSELYLQVLPKKLTLSPSTRGNNSHKNQISKVLLSKISQVDTLNNFFALSQYQFVLIYPRQVHVLTFTPQAIVSFASPTFKYFYLSQLQDPIRTSTNLTHSHHITNSSVYQKQPIIISSFLMCIPYVALITDDNSLLILNIQNMKISNMMINDNNFTSGCFNVQQNLLVIADYGGYLMSLNFNKYFGDIEQEGIGIRKKTLQQSVSTPKYSTFFINTGKKQANNKLQLDDQILSKQKKTAYTVIVQNYHRNPITLMTTKKASLFTYQSKFVNVIKIWNIHSLKVIQKIDLNIQIYDMKISNKGLYIISRQKGYLCYYTTQKQNIQNSQKNNQNSQISSISISSNIMYINTITLSQSIVYKLKISNKPNVAKYIQKNAVNVQKSLKYVFYKNQVFLFNSMKTYSPVLEVYGIFGENKQVVSQLKQYHSMIEYRNKQGIILWSNNKIYICCNQGASKLIHKSYQKGQYIFTNYTQTNPKSPSSSLKSIQTITMLQKISKIKCYENYLTIICYPNKNNNSTKSNSYVYDQNSMSLCIVFQQLDQDYRIIECHKYCSIIMKYNKNKGNKRQYFLYQHKSGKRLWEMDYIQGWNFQTVNIICVTQNYVQILCVYKSNTVDINQRTIKQKPIYYLIKTKIKLVVQQKTFINISKISSTSQVYSQTQTFQQILQRSIYNKITNTQINTSTLHEQIIQKNVYKLFNPLSILNKLKNKKINKNIYTDIKSMESKILYYQQSANVIIMGVILHKVLILYEMSNQIVGEIIGILDFGLGENVGHNGKQFIVYWNEEYKKQDEQLWEQTKNRAINRVHNKNPSPILIRSDSLRNTNRIWNPDNIQQELIIPDISRTKSYNKITHQSDPQRLNQMFHKHNILSSIVKQSIEIAKKNVGSIQRKKQRKSKAKEIVDQKQIKALTTAVRLTKQTFYNQRKGMQTIQTTASKQIIDSKLKTQQSIGSFGSKVTLRTTDIKNKTKKVRYQTQAIEQLQKSKIIEQNILPKLDSRNQSVHFQKQKRSLIYDLLKKQNFSLKQSRSNQSRLQQSKEQF